MRILHVIFTLDPVTGGPPRVACRIATAQALLGHQVTIVSHSDTELARRVSEMTCSFRGFDQVKQSWLAMHPGRWEEMTAIRDSRKIRPLVDQADVVHIHNVWDSINRGTASHCLRTGKPYFVQPNGMLDLWCMQPLRKKLVYRLGYRHLLRSAACLCLGNPQEAQGLDALNLQTPRVLVPLNAMFLEELSNLPQAGEGYRLIPGLANRPYLVFMGRLHYKKGLDYLAEGFARAARQIPDLDLVVIGHDEGAKDDFLRRIAGHHLTGRVHLVGPRHGSEKWALLRDAQAFILPSRQEGFSIAITEALASRLPVIISPQCHFDEVATAGAGLIPPPEPRAIGQAIAAVVSDPARRSAMADSARRLIETRYNAMSAAQALVDAYIQALKPR